MPAAHFAFTVYFAGLLKTGLSGKASAVLDWDKISAGVTSDAGKKELALLRKAFESQRSALPAGPVVRARYSYPSNIASTRTNVYLMSLIPD